MRRPVSGFTLIEMIVVIAILVAITGIVIPLVDNHKTNAMDTASRTSMTSIRDAIKTYYLDTGKYPESIGNLLTMPVGMSAYTPATKVGWNGPYLLSTGSLYQINTSKNFVKYYNSDWILTGADLTNPDQSILDSFSQANGTVGSPFVLQIPDVDANDAYDATELKYIRLVSAGPDGVLDTPRDVLVPTDAQKNDDLVLYLRVNP